MPRSRFLLALACLVVVAAVATAEDDPLISDRPDFTESSTTVSRGRLQFEMGYTRLVAGDTRITTLGEILVRFGVAENTEGRIWFGSYAWFKNQFENHDGLSDLHLGVNLGWSHLYVPRNQDRFSTWWGSLSLGAALGNRLGVFVETFGFNREDIDGNATAYLDVGLTFLVHENLQLDGRVGQGFNGLDEDWFTGIGLVTRI